MSANVTRLSEAVRLVDRGAKRERSQRTDPGHRHQMQARRLNLDFVEYPLGEPLDFLGHDESVKNLRF